MDGQPKAGEIVLSIAGIRHGEHTYLLVFPPWRASEAMRATNRWIDNPLLNFTHFDAERMCHNIADKMKETP